VIDWEDTSGKPVAAQFPDNPSLWPCAAGNMVSRCVVKQPDYAAALYPYTCNGCFDPVIGPVSHTQPGGGANRVRQPERLELLPILVYDFDRLLHLPVGFSPAPQTPPSAPMPSKPASMATAIPVLPALACLSGRVAVYPPDGSKPDSPVAATENGILQFTGAIPYTATEPKTADGTALCVDGTIPSATQACTISSAAKGKYTYTLTSTACSASPPETIVVQ
jgi:hypothetical protein